MIKESAILKDGIIYTGKRHSDIIRQMIINGISVVRPRIDGFVTDDGKFVDRKEAGQIAFESGQIKNPTSLLFSEDLY